MQTCATCGAPFEAEKGPGRRPRFCSAECRENRHREGLPDSADCPTCGRTFKPGRPSGVVQRYCRRLCNPKYGWTCTVCGTIRDAGGRGRAQTPADTYVCHPCRRQQWDEKLTVPVRDNCLLCNKPLSESQRESANKFCGRGCAYKFQIISAPQPTTHRRVRRFGGLRPLDVEAGTLAIGPYRRQKFSIHVHDDGALSIGCPWCGGYIPITNGQDRVWCEPCSTLICLDKDLEVGSDG